MKDAPITVKEAQLIADQEFDGQRPTTVTGGWLLKTGAKLVSRPDGYWIRGYFHDGSDVISYLKQLRGN